ncbi:MAG: hydroxymethylbilane synthase [Myxococcales bacterium]|nr:hydroxymethylbilane synthase [Myxococcales bacterium]
MSTTKVRLGTRGSLLAVTQSQMVADQLSAATGVEVELVVIKTRGDQVTDRPLQQVGGKGLFTKEIEDALLAREVDFAVHSMKDMPTDAPAGLIIGAVPERVDARDVLVGARLADLPEGAVVGTGSVRRALQLRHVRPDLEIRGIRGNVDTRIEKQRRGEYAAIVLALAGMTRLGRAADATEAIDLEVMVPAVGQGALCIQCRGDDRAMLDLLSAIHHAETGICVEAERAFLKEVSGGCSAPAACHARMVDGMVVADAVWAADDHGPLRRRSARSDTLHAPALGTDLARKLKLG